MVEVEEKYDRAMSKQKFKNILCNVIYVFFKGMSLGSITVWFSLSELM